jgi:hypothetical protein
MVVRPFIPLQDQTLSPILLVHLFLLNMFVLLVVHQADPQITLEAVALVDI